MVSGLQYIHNLNITHGDLKSVCPLHLSPSMIMFPDGSLSKANVLINANCDACLVDFGLATVVYSTNTFTSGATSMLGTLRWMASEMFSYDSSQEDAGRPNRAADIYALAMVFWEVGYTDTGDHLQKMTDRIPRTDVFREDPFLRNPTKCRGLGCGPRRHPPQQTEWAIYRRAH